MKDGKADKDSVKNFQNWKVIWSEKHTLQHFHGMSDWKMKQWGRWPIRWPHFCKVWWKSLWLLRLHKPKNWIELKPLSLILQVNYSHLTNSHHPTSPPPTPPPTPLFFPLSSFLLFFLLQIKSSAIVSIIHRVLLYSK